MALVPNENSPAQDSYHALLIEIKERIRAAQYAALRAAIRACSRLNDIRQQGETWGHAVG